MRRGFLVLAITFASLAACSATADDWRQWRGPTGDNHAPAGAIAPTVWDKDQNIAWRTALPGKGHSSPVLVGDRVYLTTADQARQTQSLLVLDRGSGALLRETIVHRGGLETDVHRNNSLASQTVASDGSRVFALFCNGGHVWVTALDSAGEILWQQKSLPYAPALFSFGYGTSPVLVDGMIVHTSEYDGSGSAIAALETEAGKPVWSTARPQRISYSPPARLPVGSGATNLLLSGNFKIAAYDPADGQELWSAPAPWQATCGVMVWDEVSGLAFASGGGGVNTRNATYAVRLGGDHGLVWQNPVKCYESSMLVAGGYLYGVSFKVGVVYCWRCSDGEQMWKKRLPGGKAFSSSPLLVDGNIYLTSERGTTFVFRASPDGYTELAINQLGDDAFATPTPGDGRLYHRYAQDEGGRRQEYLVAIGP